ncbi:Sensory histidine kinase in two-component regulatory system with RstA [Klebsiella pneumoniae IS53]|nr:Sensory histidine kinase in two-component regulatory system with RstA [Klebsiella pneumoniae IS53]
MGGEVRCEASPLGGARFCFSWPVYHQLPDFHLCLNKTCAEAAGWVCCKNLIVCCN